MRSLDVVRSLLSAGLLLLVTGHPAVARRAVCPDGRFVQGTSILPGSATGAFAAVVIQEGEISIEGACDPTRVHMKGLRNGESRVRARWKRCGDTRRVRLAGKIGAGAADEPCQLLSATVRGKKIDPAGVSATRTECGDGIVDPGNGETCDPPGSSCTAECQTGGGVGPIVAPARTWTWVPFPDSYCADGSTTGIGINPGDAGGRLLIYLMGGGACWDELTCYTAKTATYIEGGYGVSEFAADAAGLLGISYFDRNDVNNIFRNDSFVFVPYCTGDVHAGSKPDAVYGTHTTRHVGFQNMTAYLQRIVPTFSGASRVVLSGSSAGGFGALTNWWQTQQAFGSLRVDLVDDSGPPLPSPYLTDQLEATWRNAWNLAAATPAGCTACASDLDAAIGFYGTNLPNHRAALLSYTQDNVIGLFFQLSGPNVEAGLDALALELAPHSIWRHFYITGNSHTMFATPGVSQNGVTVREFLTKMITDDPTWADVEP